ncbi:C25 family cysteine peptidase [Kitasatospora sp. NPDC007106]|uniref:C25 family cysteine peptidase n=1 Tax=Kitasatospora sp. NPDC007106 TaxID=3156914 RepID=UPI0033F8EBC5
MDAATKIIVTNYSAMQKKGYGQSALASVRAEVAKLVQADLGRGIATTVVDLSSGTDMAAYGASAVTSETDEKQNKDAVDAVFHSARPDYLMILGSYDVVPHQSLKNLAPDSDSSVPSDLPYACETTYDAGGGEPSRFTNPSRVVGRLPDVTGSHDPAYLTSLIAFSAAHTPAGLDAYQTYVGLSAAVWEKSTRENLTTVFGGSSALHLVPPDGSPWSSSALAGRSHFVNCHGASNDPQWYGQSGSNYPVALKADDVDKPLTGGTILAAECCYGAELYEPDAHTRMSICNTYLRSGAVVFFASTNIAYGPADYCDQADLITQYAVREALKGRSSGYAVLKARLDYVKRKTTLDAVDLKTLSQFILLGDPSLRPVQPPKPAAEGDAKAALTERRREARRAAHVLEQSIYVPEPIPGSARSSELESRLREIGERHGLPPTATISSFAGVWQGSGAMPRSSSRRRDSTCCTQNGTRRPPCARMSS